MSYLSDLKKGKLSPVGFLKNSVGWLARQAGLDDAKVTELEAAADKAIDDAIPAAETLFASAVATAFPAIPEAARAVIAHQAAVAAAQVLTTSVSAAGAMIQKVN